MKPIAPNTLIQNRYLIVHLIGKGGMGEVYLAVDQRLGSAIALKRTFFSDDATLGHAFEREARTLARLRHPVLPKVSDHFTEEGTQYLVMEHISGDDLSKRLENMEKPFPLSWVLFWADQLLDSLTYLHTHEPPIVHRDIKPQNLKLTDENHIVLLDFGLSKNTLAGETRATTSGSIVGYTPHYAPMEQIRGTGTDARSDIYSLSATLYQILTGNVPPDALTRADSMINGMGDPIAPISVLNTEVSKAVSDVIIKGMAISQEQRYKSARQMQKALRDAYARLQTDKSAPTAVLTPTSQAEIPQSQQKTAIISNVPVVSQTPLPSPPPTASDSVTAQNNANSYSSQTPVGGSREQDFEKTLRYDADSHNSSAKQSDIQSSAKQSNIQTEVFLAGSLSSAIPAQEEKFSPTDNFPRTGGFDKGESFTPDADFAADDDFGKAQNYSPDVTVPLFTFDKNEAAQAGTTSAFDSISEGGDRKTSAGASFMPPENYSQPETTFTPTPAPVKQKSSSKAIAVVGILAVLLFLAIGGAGVGWYMLRDNGGTTEKITPTPTAEASVSVEPTAAPTLEVVTETNTSTNSEVEISNTKSVTTNSAINRPKIEVVIPKPRPTQVVQQPTPGQPPPTRPPPTPRPSVPTPVKTPKPRPTIVIVQ